jgi:hypothetical protein
MVDPSRSVHTLMQEATLSLARVGRYCTGDGGNRFAHVKPMADLVRAFPCLWLANTKPTS